MTIYIGLIIIFSLLVLYGMSMIPRRSTHVGLLIVIIGLIPIVIILMVSRISYFVLIPILLTTGSLGWFISTREPKQPAKKIERIEKTTEISGLPKEKQLKKPKTINGEFTEITDPQKLLKKIPDSEIIKYVVEKGVITPKD